MILGCAAEPLRIRAILLFVLTQLVALGCERKQEGLNERLSRAGASNEVTQLASVEQCLFASNGLEVWQRIGFDRYQQLQRGVASVNLRDRLFVFWNDALVTTRNMTYNQPPLHVNVAEMMDEVTYVMYYDQSSDAGDMTVTVLRFDAGAKAVVFVDNFEPVDASGRVVSFLLNGDALGRPILLRCAQQIDEAGPSVRILNTYVWDAAEACLREAKRIEASD